MAPLRYSALPATTAPVPQANMTSGGAVGKSDAAFHMNTPSFNAAAGADIVLKLVAASLMGRTPRLRPT